MAGTPVVKAEAEAVGLYRDYNGQRYWLCCASCGPLFDADPGRYAPPPPDTVTEAAGRLSRLLGVELATAQQAIAGQAYR